MQLAFHFVVQRLLRGQLFHVITVFSQRVGGFCLHPVWIFDFLDYSITKWDAARRLQ